MRYASLVRTLFHIVLLGSKSKMERIAASGSVARMEDAGCTTMVSVWDGTIGNHPRKTMGFVNNAINPKSGVIVKILAGFPYPTVTSFINEVPKAVYNRFIHVASFVSTLVRGGVLATPRTRIITQGASA